MSVSLGSVTAELVVVEQHSGFWRVLRQTCLTQDKIACRAVLAKKEKLFTMRRQPNKNIIDIKVSRSDIKSQLNQILLRVFQLNAVYFKKNKHDVNSCPLVSVDKRVIGDNRATHCRCFGQ